MAKADYLVAVEEYKKNKVDSDSEEDRPRKKSARNWTLLAGKLIFQQSLYFGAFEVEAVEMGGRGGFMTAIKTRFKNKQVWHHFGALIRGV